MVQKMTVTRNAMEKSLFLFQENPRCKARNWLGAAASVVIANHVYALICPPVFATSSHNTIRSTSSSHPGCLRLITGRDAGPVKKLKLMSFWKLFALSMMLETVWKNQRDLRSSLWVAHAVLRITKFHYASTPTRHALQPLGGAGSSKDNEIPCIIRD